MSKIENFKNKENTAGFNQMPENINTGGRPKGTKNRSTTLKNWTEVQSKFKDIDGKEVTGTYEDRIVLSLIQRALNGDVSAIKEILDTLYGKITDKQQTELKAQGFENKYADYTNEELIEALNSIPKIITPKDWV